MLLYLYNPIQYRSRVIKTSAEWWKWWILCEFVVLHWIALSRRCSHYCVHCNAFPLSDLLLITDFSTGHVWTQGGSAGKGNREKSNSRWQRPNLTFPQQRVTEFPQDLTETKLTQTLMSAKVTHLFPVTSKPECNWMTENIHATILSTIFVWTFMGKFSPSSGVKSSLCNGFVAVLCL